MFPSVCGTAKVRGKGHVNEQIRALMDTPLDLEARRLFVSTVLAAHAVRLLGGRIAAGSDAEDLLALARRLGDEAGSVERRHRLRFHPPYPGVTAGPEEVAGGPRLLLACTASGDEGKTPLGVVFTTLIPGRLPQVSVAPVEARVPEGWRPAADPF